MNISANTARLGAQAAGNAIHKAEEQKKYLNAGGETSEVHAVGSSNDAFSKKLSDVFKRGNSDLIHGLSELSDADKTEIAANAYFQMQGRVYQAIQREEADIKTFTALADEKSKLTGMLEGQTGADAGETEKKLADVQSRIDKFLSPAGADGKDTAVFDAVNSSSQKSFAAYSAVFEEITGIKSDALEAGDSLLLRKTDRAESSFLSKANETIDSLKKQSEGLHDVKKLFFGQENGEDGTRLSEEAMVKMAVFEFFREKFAYGGTADELYDSLKGVTLLDTNA